MNEFKRFEDRLTGLIESLSPSGRRRLSAELAKRLRQSQQRRVMAQKAPDGTPYAPRQQQSARKKTGRVKRKMFAKLITSRFLHSRSYVDQSKNEYHISLTGGNAPGTQLDRQLQAALEKYERDKRARARASMMHDG